MEYNEYVLDGEARERVVTDTYDRTLSVVALVKYMSEKICFTTGKKFYKLDPRILTAFFDNCLRKDFKKRGGWNRLEKHLNKKYREYRNECAAYGFVIDDIPDDLKLKIRHTFTSKSELLTEVPCERISDLYITREVSSVGTSLLNEINLPKTYTEKYFPKEAEGSSSTKANGLED
ncbi:uncharacterized protein TNCT_472701 [Trichonephila clavata]|uniref:Uncharacterized protein n=1 Tax=Trichonephila clavata TaxID=2740835 RepID=A0A8X6KKN4_TRICU|nr:uncharacterized protein TNCT_472701 [Trichonephila clavata]